MASCPKVKSVIALFIILSFGTNGLKMIFEKLKLTYTNDKYLEDVHANVRRYKRNGDYYMNLWGFTKQTWANNVSVHIVVTEFLHNEYRRSFIEFHYRLCDLINKEPMIGQMLAKKGVVCPAPKGEYRLFNMTVQSHNFPNRWPFDKGGADINVNVTDTGELIAAGYVHILFKNDGKGKGGLI